MSKTKEKRWKNDLAFLSAFKYERYKRALRGEEDPIERQRRFVKV